MIIQFYRTKEELAEEAKRDVVNTYPAFLLIINWPLKKI
jgi:hypothetical protein